MKTLYVLIGLKGSGKTFISKLLESRLNIPFLRVENIFLGIKKDRHYLDKDYIKEGFNLLEDEIRKQLEIYSPLTIESTGTADEFKGMINNLRKNINVKLIKIEANPDLCIERVMNRDSRDHVNVSDKDVSMINELAMKQEFEYDLVIDNDCALEENILFEFEKFLL